MVKRLQQLRDFEHALALLTSTPPQTFSSTRNFWICAPCFSRTQPDSQKRLFSSRTRKQQTSYEQRPSGTPTDSLRDVPTSGFRSRWHNEGKHDGDRHGPDESRQASRDPDSSQSARIASVHYLMELASRQHGNPTRSHKKAYPTSRPNEDIRKAHNQKQRPDLPFDSRQTELIEALGSRNFDQVARIVNEAASDVPFLTSIPVTTWTQILELFDPRLRLLPLHKLHRSFNPARLRQLGYSHRQAAMQFVSSIIQIIQIRRDGGMRMTLADYRVLLRHTARRGDAQFAKALWSELEREGCVPDLACYNAYMAAVVWNEESRIQHDSRMRNVQAKYPESGGRVTLFSPGASSDLRDVFNQMHRNGVMPDTESYCSLMVALERDGRMLEVEQILVNVFHIDVESFRQGTPNTLEDLPTSSYTQPNKRLLVTIAEIFGEANQLPIAFKIIDHISSTYNVPLTMNVWSKLAQWLGIQTTVSTKGRSRHSGQQHMLTKDIQALGDMMSREPYATRPTIEIRQTILRAIHSMPVSGDDPATFIAMRSQLEAARVSYMQLVTRSRAHGSQLKMAIEHPSHSSRTGPKLDQSLLRHRVRTLDLKKRMAQITLHRLARKLLSRTVPSTADDSSLSHERSWWRLTGTPSFILDWQTFLPHVVKYRIHSGTVELRLRDGMDINAQQQRRTKIARRKRLQWLDTSVLKQPWTLNRLSRRKRMSLRDDATALGTRRHWWTRVPPEVNENAGGLLSPSDVSTIS